MPRNLLALLLAVSVAATSLSAAPARADGDDFARALVGISALAIIGTAIANSRDDDHHATRYRYKHHGYGHKRAYGYKKRYGHKRHYGYKRHGYKRYYGHKRHYRHKSHRAYRHGYDHGYRPADHGGRR